MIYFATGSDPVLLEAIENRSDLGVISTYNGNASTAYPPRTPFVADNGCFSGSWNAPGWRRYLERHAARAGHQTRWAVCPDVVADHEATLGRWAEYAEWIRSLLLIPAFVLQDGCTSWGQVPDDARALFIGGTTEYKLGADVAALVAEAPSDRWIHMGRVNSLKRTLYAASIGCHSVDGTFASFGPKVNVPKICSWLDRVNGGTT